MQERHLCWLPYFFPWPSSAPHFFHSRIATVTPVSHPLTRLIHISPSCWIIYRSFEIILEMGTVHRIELQIQFSIQIHCFKKHSIRYELCEPDKTLMNEPERSARERSRENTYYERYCFIQVTCNMNAKGQTWNENNEQ